MSQSLEEISINIGDAKLTIPADSLAKAWLEKNAQSLGIAPQPEKAADTSQHPRIGEFWKEQGGVLAGMMRGIDGQPDYWLIVPTDPLAEHKGLAWGESSTISGALSEFDGLTNTKAILATDQHRPAARFAAELNLNGFNDYYLPARRELSLMYANVPELFQREWHWSSTQSASSSGGAWIQHFGDGSQTSTRKVNEYRVRAVRRLSVI